MFHNLSKKLYRRPHSEYNVMRVYSGQSYQENLRKAGMIEYTKVSGCNIIRPYAFRIWEEIQGFVDKELKQRKVENAYFPLFITQDLLEKEANHLEGFKAEVAWVTRAGNHELAEPLAIRPTSETIMYEAYGKWIRSYRDLPLKINQWTNVVRWEFKHPTPFLRGREFLWQEGHTVYQTREEAVNEVIDILGVYAKVYEELLAIPVIKGYKSEKEKFAGADFTTTVECFVPSNGKSIQGGTSHHLGQNFAKMFDISFLDEENVEQIPFQNSWGLSTRSIGALCLIHADEVGIILPPRVAPIQVAIFPLLKSNDAIEEAEKLSHRLESVGIRAVVETNIGSKQYSQWFDKYEEMGVPVQLHMYPKEYETEEIVYTRRDKSEIIETRKGKRRIPEKGKISLDNGKFESDVQNLLNQIQSDMYNSQLRKRRIQNASTMNEMRDWVDQKYQVLAPFCGDIVCEKDIEEQTRINSGGKIKTLCKPFDEQHNHSTSEKCLNCGSESDGKYLFGKSY